MSSVANKGPLSGIRIVDFTLFLSGPFATQILGDLGAEVIKVEAPEGDLSRTVPPAFVDGSSTYFGCTNRNKKSVVLDMRTDEGIAAAQALIGTAHAVVENFRPGKLAKLGLNYADLSKTRPDLVWASISGFGQDGPYRDRPAYDMVVQAMSGVMSITGEPDGAPVRAGIPVGDLCAGLYAVIGLLAALIEARSTGVGRQIDVSMLDVQVAMLSYQASAYLQGAGIPGRQGSAHDSIPSYRCFLCADGKRVAVTANTEAMFRALARTIGLARLIDDARFTDSAARYANRDTLAKLLEDAFLQFDSSQIVDALIEAQVPTAVVDDFDAVFKNPHIIERGMALTLTGPLDGQALRVAGDPLKFVPSGRTEHSFPPRLGEHTAEITRSLGGRHPT